MPTLNEWQAALSFERQISIDSSQRLADQINAKPNSKKFDGISKQATPVNQVPLTARITPFDLLFALGRITTPRIDNLADLCSTWARIRYIWAFDPRPDVQFLRLSQESAAIDFHQKGLMSDEVGVGMSALIVERFFNCTNPIDVDVALRAQGLVGLQRRFNTLPDYLFQDDVGNFIVVECKGTTSAKSSVITQLKRGTEQVPSLEFPGGNQPVTLVIGTRLGKRDTTVYLVDPPAGKSSGKSKYQYLIRDEAKFRSDVQNIQYASLYLFAGVTSRAADLYPIDATKDSLRKSIQRDQPPAHTRSHQLQEDIVGIEQSIPLIGEIANIKIFQGVPENILNALEERNHNQLLDHADTIFRRGEGVARELHLNREEHHLVPYWFEQTQNTFRVESIHRDGSFLRLEVTQ